MTRRREPRPEVLGIYRRLFAATAKAGVRHAVWKNLHEVEDALRGRGDLDLYVPSPDAARFAALLQEHGFVALRAAVHHAGIAHHYGLDEATGTLCHLHVYYRIVTGESHIKQYVLPIERYLDDFPVVAGAQGIPVLHPELMRRLAAFRRAVKRSCLPGAWLYARERAGYREERRRLAGVEMPSPGAEPDGWLREVRTDVSGWREVLFGLRYRRRFAALRRFGVLSCFLRRYGQLPLRALNRVRGRRKRLDIGLIVGIVGLDGAGKSSQLEALERWLSRDIDTLRLHYGRARPVLSTLPVRMLLDLRRRLLARRGRLGQQRGDEGQGTPRGLIAHLRYLALARERQAVLGRALRASARGQVVLCDRWYSQRAGRMDSPRLSPAVGTPWLAWIARLENRLYERSPDPDLLLKLEVDLDTALARNRARVKADKETDEELRERFRRHGDLSYRSARVVTVDSRDAFEDVARRLRAELWRSLRERGA